MNPAKLKALFPNASASTLVRNQSNYDDADCAHVTGPRSLGSKLEDRFCQERLPTLLTVYSCVRRQFRVRVSTDGAVVPCHYTSDFAIWHPVPHGEIVPTPAWRCVMWEVKDKRRKPHSDELTRPKLTRLMNPWISEIWLATWDGHAWATRQLA